jgi:membrane-bound ClpP family serine protease
MCRNHRLLTAACAPALFLLLAGAGRAEGPPAEGQCLAVRSPLTSEEVNRVKEVSTWVLSHAQERKDVKLVYDFNPGKGSAATAEFGPCNELAEYLMGLRDVTTIAFVHGEVSRHTVLPVLACKELIMSADARLGPVVDDQDPPLTATKVQGYKDVVRGRALCPAVVLKLLDRDMEVLQGVRKGAVWYIDARREQEERDQDGVIVSNHDPVVGRGRASYTTAQAQTFGLCQRKLETLQEVVTEYNLPRAALREDALLGRDPVAWQTTLSGPVSPALAESVRRRIRRAIGSSERHANLIVLQLDCVGGDPATAQGLAEWLHGLKDDRNELPVKTVAYVHGSAAGTATLVALGCSDIVLQKGATIGDLSVLAAGAQAGEGPPDEGKDSMLLQQVKALAEDQGYPVALIRGMVYKGLPVYEVDSARGQRRSWLVTEPELRADARSPEPRWKNPRQVQSVGQAEGPLVLDDQRAEEVRLSRHTVDDVRSLYDHYGIKPEQVRSGGNDWLDDFAYVLRLPAMSIFLIMLGVTCLILELKMPGLGLPGVIAALCFVLFFWAHAHDAGITLLAVLLFVLGLVLIGLEVFMLPGSAVFGISGAVLVLASLTLVTIDRWPQTTHEWVGLGSTVASFGFSLLGAVIAALVLAWYLPHIPYVNRLILKPPGEAAAEGLAEPPATAAPDMSALLGAIGVAATPLRPAGKVKFGDDFVDVVAEGSYVQPGARVQVIEIEGYRIVVKEV